MHPLLTIELGRIRTQEMLAEAAAYRLHRSAPATRSQPSRLGLSWSLWRRPTPVAAPCTTSHV
ncbi:MAG: hypothetical protein ACRDTM_02995 [Micromonosporaceae bacterium]